MMSNQMSMNRMSQMNCPPGSANGAGMMANGSELGPQPSQQQMAMNQQNFANSQYHQVCTSEYFFNDDKLLWIFFYGDQQ
jgi:hypothetical protein